MKVDLGIDKGEAFMEAAYAPSGRATCRGCNEKIEKGVLRLTNTIDNDHFFHKEMHFHADCFQLKKMFMEANYKDVFHVESLKKDDQIKVQEILDKLKKQQKGPIKKSQAKKKQQKQKVVEESSSSVSSEREVQKKISSIILDGKPKIKTQVTKNESQEKQVKSSKKAKDESSDEEQEPDVFCLYTKEQKSQYRKFEKELQSKSNAQFKQMLRDNDQKQCGTKSELIERIADCKVLGCLGKCPHCTAGRPKLNKINKKFKCPGYMDDTEFKHCNKTFTPEELVRTPWQE